MKKSQSPPCEIVMPRERQERVRRVLWERCVGAGEQIQIDQVPPGSGDVRRA